MLGLISNGKAVCISKVAVCVYMVLKHISSSILTWFYGFRIAKGFHENSTSTGVAEKCKKRLPSLPSVGCSCVMVQQH